MAPGAMQERKYQVRATMLCFPAQVLKQQVSVEDAESARLAAAAAAQQVGSLNVPFFLEFSVFAKSCLGGVVLERLTGALAVVALACVRACAR